MRVTSVRLHSKIEKPLVELAKQFDRSKSYLINQAITEFIARQAMEKSRWQDTLEALEDVKNGKVTDANTVNQWLNSWGNKDELSAPAAK
ncbi:Prevent host death protein, Phd antitoxin |nr:Prevent host death protein, Phd antitoxin \